MPRNYTTPHMTYNQRLEFWQGKTCPYCGSSKIEARESKNGSRHFECMNPECKAQNHFSRNTRLFRIPESAAGVSP